MANQYIKVEDQGDKFDKKIVAEMKEQYEVENEEGESFYFNIGRMELQDDTLLYLEVTLASPDGLYDMANGSILIRIDGSEDITLDRLVETFRSSIEVDRCLIDQDILKKICEAHTIDIKFYGKNGNVAIEANGLIQYAQRFYNGCIDEAAYTDSLKEDDSNESKVGDSNESKGANSNESKGGESKGGCMSAIVLMIGAISSLAMCVAFVINMIH